jgi:hypothetical protein
MKMASFWDVAPWSLVKTDRRFRGAYRLNHHDDDSDTGYVLYVDTCGIPLLMIEWYLQEKDKL